MDVDVLARELTCPITQELLIDPVTLPCCGKSVGRQALRSALVASASNSCPLCRAHLRGSPDEAADAVPRNLVAQALLETLAAAATPLSADKNVSSETQEESKEEEEKKADVEEIQDAEEEGESSPRLLATYSALPSSSGSAAATSSSGAKLGRIARLQLRIPHASRLPLRRVLCLLVVDQSGSMWGSPWRQASLALRHVVTMSRQRHVSGHVALKIVTYNSSSAVLDTSGSVEDVHRRINGVSPGGGTSFRAAFAKAEEVMHQSAASALIGQNVVLRNLEGREELNGAGGTVVDVDGVGASLVGGPRLVVQLEDGSGKRVSVRPAKVEFLSVGDKSEHKDEGVQQVSVIFMTDGQASERQANLVEEFRTVIDNFRRYCTQDIPQAYPNGEPPEVTVHAVGFSRSCDKNLLDSMRSKCGSRAGQFRYCEPGDSEDALCGRITGVFESVANHGGCELGLARVSGREIGGSASHEEATWEFLDEDGSALPPSESGRARVQLRIKPDGMGTAVAWVSLRSSSLSPLSNRGVCPSVLPIAVTCNAPADSKEDKTGTETTLVRTKTPDWTVDAAEDTAFASVDAVKRAWVGVRIHAIAEDAIELLESTTASSSKPPEAVRLWGALLENRLRAVSTVGSDAHDRVPALLQQLRGLANWGTTLGTNDVSLGRLRDISSASAFSSSRAPVSSNLSHTSSASASARPAPGDPPSKPRHPTAGAPNTTPSSEAAAQPITISEKPIFYTGNHSRARRTELQSAVMGWGQHSGADKLVSDMLSSLPMDKASEESVFAMDADGNTTLHLAAYHGQYDAIPVLLDAAGPGDVVDMPNHYGETPITIAIKRRGYHKSVEVLQSLGGSIPEDRVEGLISYCLRENYVRTAAFLRERVENGSLGPTGTRDSSTAGTASWMVKSGSDLPPLVFDDSMPAVVVKSRLKNATAQGRPIDGPSLVRVALRVSDEELLKRGLDMAEPSDVEMAWVFADCFPRRADAPDTSLFLFLLQRMVDFAPDLLHAVKDVASGDTLLHRAVTAGSLPHVQYLIEKGISPDVTNSLGNSPLHVACERKYPCIVDHLLTSGADFAVTNRNGKTPLSLAVQMGSTRIAEAFFASGATVDGPAAKDGEGNNLLHVAVLNNRTDVLRALLDRTDPECLLESNKIGLTPLLVAIEGDRKECVNIIIDTAADYARLGVPGFATRTAIGLSVASPTTHFLDRTMPSDASVLPGATALHASVHFGRTHALATLLERGANPNLLDGGGLSPLHRAARRGNADAVYALLARGGNAVAPDTYGRTATFHSRGSPEVLAALLGPVPGPLRAFAEGRMSDEALASCASPMLRKAGALVGEPGLLDVTSVLDSPLGGDGYGMTALMVAAANGNAVAAEALVAAGASPTKEDGRGMTAGDWAQISGNRRLCAALGIPVKPLLPAAQRHVNATKKYGGSDAAAIFLGGRRDPSWQAPTAKSSLPQRLMSLVATFEQAKVAKGNSNERPQHGIRKGSELLASVLPRSSGSPDRVVLGSPGAAARRQLDSDRWACKVDAAAAVAGGSDVRPSHMYTALLATRHGPLLLAVNDFLRYTAHGDQSSMSAEDRALLDFAATFRDALDALPPVGATSPPSSTSLKSVPTETGVYAVVPPGLDQSTLSVGTEVTLDVFVSATTDKSFALSALEDCEGMEKGPGTLLIVRPTPRARVLGTMSSFPEEGEVVFTPGTRLRVAEWRRDSGDYSERGDGVPINPLDAEETKKAEEERGDSFVVVMEDISSREGV